MILVFALAWLWFSIGLYVDSHYSINDLKPHIGKIERLNSSILRVKRKLLYKQIIKQLKVTLSSDPGTYTVETTKNFGEILSKISVGDSVTVFTKPKLWGIFGLKKATIINHLIKNGEVVIDYSLFKKSISGFFYPTLIFSLILLIVYIVRLKKRIWWEFDGHDSEKGMS